MNKKELYNRILQLDGLTNEEKSELLGLLRKQKRYGLVWEDKPEDVEERLREELPVLVEDASKAIIKIHLPLYYSSMSEILNFAIISLRFSDSLLICWLAAAHSCDVAELVCTTSLICSIPSLICLISLVWVSSVSAILITSFVITLEFSATSSSCEAVCSANSCLFQQPAQMPL